MKQLGRNLSRHYRKLTLWKQILGATPNEIPEEAFADDSKEATEKIPGVENHFERNIDKPLKRFLGEAL